MTKVRRQTVDDLSSPAAAHLLGNELTADVPIKCYQFIADGKCSLHLCPADAFFQVAQEVVVLLRLLVTSVRSQPLLLHHSHERLSS